MNEQNAIAAGNLVRLRSNPYPGRGLIQGISQDAKHLVQICWTMGRSDPSRNRVYGYDSASVFTEVADPSKPSGDPKMTIYNAMGQVGDHSIVTNGHQTDTIRLALQKGATLAEGLVEWRYEPDEPNYTPRISGIYTRRFGITTFSILRKSPFDDSCERHLYLYEVTPPGFGRCLTTYMDNGKPLPAFQGEPLLVRIIGDIGAVRNTFWDALDPDNKVSLAVKFTSIETGEWNIEIANKYEMIRQQPQQ